MNKDIAALVVEAERYLGQEDVDRATMLYRKALELDPSAPLPTIGLARVALIIGRLNEAQAFLDYVLEAHPTSVEALTFRGVVADARNDPKGALRYLERALAIDSRYAPAQVNIGRVLGQLGEWTQALRAFRTALILTPRNLEVMPLLAMAAFRTGALGEAMKTLTQLLQQKPDHVDGLVSLADVLMEAKLDERAAELLANAVERLPEVAVLHARQSAVALRRGNLDLARSAVTRQLELTPNDEEALLYGATLDLMKRDIDSAERRAQHVLSFNPTSWRAHYHLGLIYDALKLRDAAMAAYRTAIRYGEQAWEPRNNLATMLLEEKKLPSAREAQRLLEEALDRGAPEETLDARYNLALAQWQLGERRASERSAREVARHKEDRSVVVDARRFLKNFSASAA